MWSNNNNEKDDVDTDHESTIVEGEVTVLESEVKVTVDDNANTQNPLPAEMIEDAKVHAQLSEVKIDVANENISSSTPPDRSDSVKANGRSQMVVDEQIVPMDADSKAQISKDAPLRKSAERRSSIHAVLAQKSGVCPCSCSLQ